MVYTGPLRRDYSYMNFRQAAECIRRDLLDFGYTPDDLDWLFSHGWWPLSPLVDTDTGVVVSLPVARR